MCLKEIEPRAHHLVTILGSLIILIEGPIWPFNEHKKVHFDSEDVFIWTPNIYEDNGYNLELCFLTILY